MLVIFFVLFLLLLPHYSLLSLSLLCLNPLPILLSYFLCLFLFLFTSCASHSTHLLFSVLLYLSGTPSFLFSPKPLISLLHLSLPWLADCLFRAPFITERHFYNHSLSWALYHGIIFLPNPHFSLSFIHPCTEPSVLPVFTLFFLHLLCLCCLKWIFKKTRGERQLLSISRMNIFYYQLCMRVENCPFVMPYVIFSFTSCHFGLYPLIRFRGEQMWFILLGGCVCVCMWEKKRALLVAVSCHYQLMEKDMHWT